MMTEDRRDVLVRWRPRAGTLYVSQSRAVLATGRDGFIAGGPDHGLFVHQTRLLSHYRYLVDGRPPQAVALSMVEQHSWLGYYIVPPSSSAAGGSGGGAGQGSPEAAQQTIELRLTRAVGDGLHEDVDLTNFTQQRVAFTLTLEVDADFADQEEAAGQRQQQGTLTRHWQEAGEHAWELVFDYRAEHRYDHQGDTGIARLHRGHTLRTEAVSSPPAYAEGRLDFPVELAPRGTWHACVKALPLIDDQRLPSLYPVLFGMATVAAYRWLKRLA